MTNTEIIQYVYAHFGSERETGLLKPEIIAFANLALHDYAKWVVDSNKELTEDLRTESANQSWSNSQINAPSDFLHHGQEHNTRLTLSGTMMHQLDDRDNLLMIGTTSNHYYALEDGTFYIKHASGTTSGTTNLTISYVKVPTASDITDEMRNKFLEFLMMRIANGRPEQRNQ